MRRPILVINPARNNSRASEYTNPFWAQMILVDSELRLSPSICLTSSPSNQLPSRTGAITPQRAEEVLRPQSHSVPLSWSDSQVRRNCEWDSEEAIRKSAASASLRWSLVLKSASTISGPRDDNSLETRRAAQGLPDPIAAQVPCPRLLLPEDSPHLLVRSFYLLQFLSSLFVLVGSWFHVIAKWKKLCFLIPAVVFSLEIRDCCYNFICMAFPSDD